jgi:ABC-type branched-subunit amino acid transport system substrate-binding protein
MRFLAGLLLAAALPAAGQALTPSETAGRRLYLEGTSASGRPVTGLVGMANSPMPGTVVACGNCHGADGLGRAEAGVLPPPITWGELTKSYGHVHESGRAHPPFNEASLARAITRGLDPAGNRLEGAMPRFQLHEDDLRDLIAYLKRIEDDADPGLSDTALRVGTVLPEAGPAAGAGLALRLAVEAVFAEANEAGGVYGRRLELVVRTHGAGPEASGNAARELAEKDRVFALVAPFALGSEAALAALAEERRIPVVGPFTVRGPAADGGRYTFHLFSGAKDQAQVLVTFALGQEALARAPLALVHPESARAAADAAAARCERKGCARTLRVAYPDGNFDAAAAVEGSRGAGAVLFLGPAEDLERFAVAMDAAGGNPVILAPGATGARAAGRLPAKFEGRFFLSFPTFPPAREAGGENAFDRFAAKHRLPAGHSLPAFTGYLSASLFVDALRRAGRALRRERLVEALEATTDYRAGLDHPLRYGPQRRVGALGGHMVAPEGRGFRAASGWIALD